MAASATFALKAGLWFRRGHLVRIACGLKANNFGDTAVTDLPEGSMWRKVRDVVYLLGRADSEWPNRGELRSWLVDEVVATLRFALGDGEALAAQMLPAATVDEADVAEPETADVEADTGIVVQVVEAEAAMMASEQLQPEPDAVKARAAKPRKPSRGTTSTTAQDAIAIMIEAAGIDSPRR